MVADSDISTETQIGSHTLKPYTLVQWSRVYVYMVHWWHMFVSVGKYITAHRYSVMVADSDMSTEMQIGSNTLPYITIV